MPKKQEGVEEIQETPKKTVQLRAKPLIPSMVRHPDIRAGVCESDGKSYKDCNHYKDVDIFCTFCGRADIIKDRKLQVFELSDKPGELIILCSDFECRNKFNNQYHLNG